MDLAAAKEISVNAALAAVLPELDGISALREEQRTALEALLGGKDLTTTQ